MSQEKQNWSRNITYKAAAWHTPRSVDELQTIVASSDKLRVVGSRHSFNEIADTPAAIVSLEAMPPHVEVDAERQTVTVGAYMKYGDVAAQLDQAGFALHNLASLPHISIAGACATATHGSGVGNGNLATAVQGMEVLTASGDIVRVSRDTHGDEFAGMVVSLGGLGVITRMTLDVIPTFQVRQDVYEHLPLSNLEGHFDEVAGAAYSVSLFTTWREAAIDQIWLKSLVGGVGAAGPPDELLGAQRVNRQMHPLRDMPAGNTTEQNGIPGPWYARLPHFKMEFTPSNGEELQSEYLLPRRHAMDAIRAVAALRDIISPLLQVTEIRTMAADDLWMSPAYHEDCIGIHFTWRLDWEKVGKVLPVLEAALAPFEARPHWGKLFTTEAEVVRSLYTRLPDFQRLLRAYDPDGKFRNEFMDRYIFG